jgi:hypothetical protein
MNYERLQGILTGGAAGRSDSISGLDPAFAAIIDRMIAEAPPEIARSLRITSAYRSPELQAQLFRDAVNKYGSEAAARKWVAPPGRSNHGRGTAIDWTYASDAARDWVHANADRYGAAFPMAHEPWHMEPKGARGGSSGGAVASAPTGTTINSTPNPVPPMIMNLTGGSGAPAAPASPLASIIGALGGGKQPDPGLTQVAPSSIGAEAGSQEAAQASLLMQTLMSDRRKRYGLSLNGIT